MHPNCMANCGVTPTVVIVLVRATGRMSRAGNSSLSAAGSTKFQPASRFQAL